MRKTRNRSGHAAGIILDLFEDFLVVLLLRLELLERLREEDEEEEDDEEEEEERPLDFSFLERLLLSELL